MPSPLGKHTRSASSLPTTAFPLRASSPTTVLGSRRGRQVVVTGTLAILGGLAMLTLGVTPRSLVPRPYYATTSTAPSSSSSYPAPALAVRPVPYRFVAPRIDPDDTATWPAPTPALPDEASLEDRLRAWNSTPVATAAQWAIWSSEALPHHHSYHNRLWCVC